MTELSSNGNKPGFTCRLIKQLLGDPTRSVRDMAKVLGSYRQRVYREKTKLENARVIWGYTAVLDESRLGHVTYLVLMKLKPMSTDLANLMIKRILNREPDKQMVSLLDVLYVNGDYDLVVKFTAPDHTTARRYYDSIRLAYEGHLLEKPVFVDVNFSLIREGKRNPDLRDLYNFVPM